MLPEAISAPLIEVLVRLVSVHGAPKHLCSDNGRKFGSRAILRWLSAEGIDTAHIDPGRPWQNGTDESINGRLRDAVIQEPHRCEDADRAVPARLQRGASALERR